MAKTKILFFCKNCGQESPKWLGKCPNCASWNTFVEEKITANKISKNTDSLANNPVLIQEVVPLSNPRIISPDLELNRVLGGGIVLGSLTLMGGEPGIGKSTLLLQMVLQQQDITCLYVSGEESESQIKMRANRLENNNQNLYLLATTSVHSVMQSIKETKAQLVVIDSIQTMYSDDIESTPGSISQVKECTGLLLRFAKENNIPILLIGHITKDGIIAGPKILEHIVDTVLQFEGDRNHLYRLLRCIKNRFGATSELGVYSMQANGLQPVSNPSELWLSQRNEQPTGVAVAAMLEGARPIFIETQSLVSNAVYSAPQRSSTGYDVRRLNMLLAVLEKKCGLRMGTKDVYVNIAGGLRVEDPAVDLALMATLISSYEDRVILPHCCFAGEIGLSGEIRSVTHIDLRIQEAQRLGFKYIFLAQSNMKGIQQKNYDIEIRPLSKVNELLK